MRLRLLNSPAHGARVYWLRGRGGRSSTVARRLHASLLVILRAGVCSFARRQLC